MLRPETDRADVQRLLEMVGEPGARLVEILMMTLPPSTETSEIDRLAKPLLGLLADEIGYGYQRGWHACQVQHETWSGVTKQPKVACHGCGVSAVSCSVQPGPCCRACNHLDRR